MWVGCRTSRDPRPDDPRTATADSITHHEHVIPIRSKGDPKMHRYFFAGRTMEVVA